MRKKHNCWCGYSTDNIKDYNDHHLIMSKWSGMNDTSFVSDLAREICSHFSKPPLSELEMQNKEYREEITKWINKVRELEHKIKAKALNKEE